MAGGQPENELSWLSSFQVVSGPSDVVVRSTGVTHISPPGNLIFREKELSWWRSEEYYSVTISARGSIDVLAMLRADSEWQSLELVKTHDASSSIYRTLGEIAFRTSILFFCGIVLHSAAINYQGRGLVFAAPSGTGKSTHANLWITLKDAEILNGDRPALRVIDGDVHVYGTPWSGTSNQYRNDSVPLEAIFLLEQSPVNSVEELPPGEALQQLTARCYLPYFDNDLMAMALSNIGEIIERVPVYRLKCRPDPGAVEAVMKWLNL